MSENHFVRVVVSGLRENNCRPFRRTSDQKTLTHAIREVTWAHHSADRVASRATRSRAACASSIVRNLKTPRG